MLKLDRGITDFGVLNRRFIKLVSEDLGISEMKVGLALRVYFMMLREAMILKYSFRFHSFGLVCFIFQRYYHLNKENIEKARLRAKYVIRRRRAIDKWRARLCLV